MADDIDQDFHIAFQKFLKEWRMNNNEEKKLPDAIPVRNEQQVKEISNDWVVPMNCNEVKIISKQREIELVDHWYENNIFVIEIKINPTSSNLS